MTASYSVLAEKRLAAAKAAFSVLGDISKIIINGAEFTPEQTDGALIAIADNWADVKGFALSRIDGVCALRVEMREASAISRIGAYAPHFTKEACNGRL